MRRDRTTRPPARCSPHLQVLTDLEVRDLGPTAPAADGTFRSTRRMWLRVHGPLPDDPLLQACIVTLLSDMGIVTAVPRRARRSRGRR